MRIKEEDFNKLKQLDRIEIYFKEEQLSKKYEHISSLPLFYVVFGVIGYIILLACVLYQKVPVETVVSLLSTLPNLVKIGIFFAIIIVFYNLYQYLQHQKALEKLRKRLNGKIILILGNHDKEYELEKENFVLIRGSLQIGNLILTHYPLRKEEIPDGFINVHGHIHNKNSFNGINVSVEKTNYEPIELKKLNNSFSSNPFVNFSINRNPSYS